MKAVLIFTVTLITFSGFSLSNKVNQSPPDVIERQGDTAKIQCSHNAAGCYENNSHLLCSLRGICQTGIIK
ncbi:hypothetical protein G5714_017315 [Onychostoma macrolepis]|uniref:Uncharacterized protein n=1 Tax=Onychostoma macrolepis TaxID=369639 RepID=A0A7J6C7D0_9TELE|nr:hypothetical protein G5714_017315 [Onychostoma macrolepis]